MKIHMQGNFNSIPAPKVANGTKLVKVILSSKFKDAASQGKMTLLSFLKLGYARLSVALLSMRHDGLWETIDRARSMSRREGLLAIKGYYSCFVGYVENDQGNSKTKLVAGFSLKHISHTEYVVARKETLFPLLNEDSNILGCFLMYGAAFVHIAEQYIDENSKIPVFGTGPLLHVLKFVLNNVDNSGEVVAYTHDDHKALCILELPSKPSSFAGTVIGIAIPKKKMAALYPNAKDIRAYCIQDFLEDESKNIDIYYDNEIDLPNWLSAEYCNKYIDLINKKNLDVPSFFSEILEKLGQNEINAVTFSDRGTEIIGFAPDKKDIGVTTDDYTVRTRDRAVTITGNIKYVSLIGGGRWPLGMSIRHLVKNKNIRLRYVCDRRPEIAYLASQAFPFEYMTTDIDVILEDKKTDLVVVAPYHGFHAPIAERVLKAGKSCYVEKPPAINQPQFDALFEAVRDETNFFHVGYNRKFAPATVKLLEILQEHSGPVNINMVIRSVDIPPSSWYYWPSNGNRVVSNICHFTDFAYLLTGYSKPVSVTAVCSNKGREDENAVVTIKFEDGSLASIFYTNKGFQKSGYDQRYQIMKGDMTAWISNFENLKIRQGRNTYTAWSGAEDMGHRKQMYAVAEALVSGSKNLIPTYKAEYSARMYLAALQSVSKGGIPVTIE